MGGGDRVTFEHNLIGGGGWRGRVVQDDKKERNSDSVQVHTILDSEIVNFKYIAISITQLNPPTIVVL